jgi:hypothetical protein
MRSKKTDEYLFELLGNIDSRIYHLRKIRAWTSIFAAHEHSFATPG